jgi:hypothetical protein
MSFYDGATLVYSITGAQLRSMGLSTSTGTCCKTTDNEYFSFSRIPSFDSIKFTTITNAFEFDLAKPVPEPSTWAMIIAGFAGLAYPAFRRRKKAPLALEPI